MSSGDFGASLKQAREQRGISLRQIATATKISVAALEALERNDFSRLPGGVFSRAFVRAYAVEVGLDPEDTVREFLAQKGAAEAAAAERAPRVEVTPDDQAFLERQRKAALVLRVALVALVILAIGLVVWWQLDGGPFGGTPASKTSRSAPKTPAPAPPPVSPPADVPVAATPPAQPPAPEAPADRLAITIETTALCWVKVTADGAVAQEGELAGGTREEFSAAREIYIQVGNAGAFTWTINGRPGKPLGGAGDVRQARVTMANFTQFVQ